MQGHEQHLEVLICTNLRQTGSGKTFTITGGPARYEDRGLLPRALAMVFEEMRRGKGEMQYQVGTDQLMDDTDFMPKKQA